MLDGQQPHDLPPSTQRRVDPTSAAGAQTTLADIGDQQRATGIETGLKMVRNPIAGDRRGDGQTLSDEGCPGVVHLAQCQEPDHTRIKRLGELAASRLDRLLEIQ